jgi:hypothetical protein
MGKLDAAIEAWMKNIGDMFPFRENTQRLSTFPS